MVPDDDQETTPLGIAPGVQKKKDQEKGTRFYQAPSETTTKTTGKTTSTGSKDTLTKSATNPLQADDKALSRVRLNWNNFVSDDYKATTEKLDWNNLKGISHWGKKRRQFYAFATLRESARERQFKKNGIISIEEFDIPERVEESSTGCLKATRRNSTSQT
ncbi:hypothetical protein Tco_0455644 [Tanacetum coccineum]